MIIGLAGVVLFTRLGRSADPADPLPAPAAAVRSGSGFTGGNGVRGPGIPPAPGASQNAPPDPNPGAPTANLKKVANNLHLNNKSVTIVATLPAGLNLTNRVDVSVLFDERGNGSQRVTQAYDGARGNRFVANVAAGNGTRRRVEVVASLAEPAPDGKGNAALYAVRSTVELEPLYLVSISPLTFRLVDDCDSYGDSEPNLFWGYPDGSSAHVSMSMRSGDIRTITKFARTYSDVGQSANLNMPSFQLSEDDPGSFHNYNTGPPPYTESVLPGTTRTVRLTLDAGQVFCRADVSYRITYTLRQFPNL